MKKKNLKKTIDRLALLGIDKDGRPVCDRIPSLSLHFLNTITQGRNSFGEICNRATEKRLYLHLPKNLSQEAYSDYWKIVKQKLKEIYPDRKVRIKEKGSFDRDYEAYQRINYYGERPIDIATIEYPKGWQYGAMSWNKDENLVSKQVNRLKKDPNAIRYRKRIKYSPDVIAEHDKLLKKIKIKPRTPNNPL